MAGAGPYQSATWLSGVSDWLSRSRSCRVYASCSPDPTHPRRPDGGVPSPRRHRSSVSRSSPALPRRCAPLLARTIAPPCGSRERAYAPRSLGEAWIGKNDHHAQARLRKKKPPASFRWLPGADDGCAGRPAPGFGALRHVRRSHLSGRPPGDRRRLDFRRAPTQLRDRRGGPGRQASASTRGGCDRFQKTRCISAAVTPP